MIDSANRGAKSVRRCAAAAIRGWMKTRTPEETERRLVEIVPKRLWPVINEALVAHGKAVCKPIGPTCDVCPVHRFCGRIGVRPRKG